MNDLEPHELAELFPLMDADRLQELADDIRTNGQIQPIIVYQGKILDGRNRFIAAKMAGREPIIEEFNANEVNRSAVEYVFSMNLQRRDLTPSMRAAIAAELCDQMRGQPGYGQAKDRGTNPTVPVPPLLPRSVEGPAAPLPQRSEEAAAPLLPRSSGLPRAVAKAAAETLKVSEKKVYDAARLRKQDPEAFEQVKTGRKTLGEAAHRPSRAKRGVEPEKLEAIAAAIGMKADAVNSLFDGISISASEIRHLAGQSPEQIKRLWPILAKGIAYTDAIKTTGGVIPMLGHTLDYLIAKWVEECGTRKENKVLTVTIEDWRFTVAPI